MSFGKRIFVDGKRPDWFRNKDAAKIIAITNWDVEQRNTDLNYNSDPETWGWDSLKYIQLPVDHEVYIALNAGLKPWRPEVNSEAVPEDYAGGNVIRRNGSVVDDVPNHPYSWIAGWNGDPVIMAGLDIVGYEPKKEEPVADIEDVHTEIAKQFFNELPKNSTTLTLEKVTDLFNIMLAHFQLADQIYPEYKPSERAGPISYSLSNVLGSLKEAGLIKQAPEPVDPDLITARTVAADVAGQGGNSRLAYENGERDDTFAVRTALAAIKATKA